MKLRMLKVCSFVVVILFLSNCGYETKHIKLGYKNIVEQYIIRELYTLLLQNAGFEVEQVAGLEETPRLHPALVDGTIDLYAEYTGTAARRILGLTEPMSADTTYAIVAEQYLQDFGIMWLDPAPMNNTWAFAMNPTTANKLRIESISDMIDRAEELVVVGDVQFQADKDGIPGMQRTFGDFRFKRYIPVNSEDRYDAFLTSQADVVIAYATDGELFAYQLKVLQDTTNFFPAYQPAPLLREDTISRYPEIVPLLNRLAPLLTDTAMQQMNYEVSTNKREPVDVARAFLRETGLLP